MSTIPNNFLGLDPKYCDYRKSDFAILPVPYEATTSYQGGTKHGPSAIIQASQQVELFDEELLGEFHKCGIATLDPIEPSAIGPMDMHEKLFKIAKRVVRDRKFLLTLGGEHSISSALVRAVRSKHEKISVLQIDAHLDLRDSYQGSPYSHASVMRRIDDMGVQIVPVGIRNMCQEEHRFLKRSKIKLFTAKECQIVGGCIANIVDALAGEVYVSIDIDGFDPAFAPGTGTPEPGGLDWNMITRLLRSVADQKTIVGADVVEVSPIPGQVVTEFLAARLAYKLICYIQASEKTSGNQWCK